MDVKKPGIWDSIKKSASNATAAIDAGINKLQDDPTSIYDADGKLRPGAVPTERMDPNKAATAAAYMKKIGG